MKKPVVLMIMDGYGFSVPEGNAIIAANKPNLDKLFAENPLTQIGASGMDVGLPDGQMGNSEVGHTNIGAGRIVYQELTRITKAVQDGTFFENDALVKAMTAAKENGTALHLIGLLSDGGVHSHNTHLYAILEMCKRNGLDRVYVDCFLDGRDTPPQSGIDFIAQLEEKEKEIGVGQIAMISGRYYAMDRDNNYDRVQKAYDALTKGEGLKAESAHEAITASYERGEYDEFVKPTVICKDGKPLTTIKDGDSIIFYNFRPDRAREITHCFCDNEFDYFDRGPRKKVTYVCFKDYDPDIPNKEVAFKKVDVTNTFGEWLAAHGMKQARIAETEKYAHVTFFFNGGLEAPCEGEDRMVIPSPKVATYDLKPEMSAYEVADECAERIKSGKYDVIILNFANCDMVGHTGVFEAAVKAVEAVDACVGKVWEATKEMGGCMFLTADHGNADKMKNEDGSPFTAHTTNVVPFLAAGVGDVKMREGGCLADIAPTMLPYIGLEVPAEMTGKSIIE